MIALYLDFFLQMFLEALAWCLAVASTLGLILGGYMLALRIIDRLPFREGGR